MESELLEKLEEIASEVEDGDGVLILVMGKNRQVKLHIPQLGLMSEAIVEQQVPNIYQLISRRRGEIAREQENERIKNRAEGGEARGGGGRSRAYVGKEPAGVGGEPGDPHEPSGAGAEKPAPAARSGAAKQPAKAG